MILFEYSITSVQYVSLASVLTPLTVIQTRRLIFDKPGAGVSRVGAVP